LGDRDGPREIYVCRAEVPGVGWVPGKLVVRRCNVAWDRRELLFDTYDVAVSETGCWGWPNPQYTQLRGDMSRADSLTVCRTHYMEDRSIWIIGVMSAQIDHGEHGGYLVPNSCRFGYGGGVRDVVLPEVYYPLCPAYLRETPPAANTNNPSDPKIASFTISPGNITAGQQTTMTIVLDSPATADFAVGIAHITSTGADNVFDEMPHSATFSAGATTMTFTVRTHHVDTVTRDTNVVFIAFHGWQQVAANLTVAP
jgi:hypothetical protein